MNTLSKTLRDKFAFLYANINRLQWCVKNNRVVPQLYMTERLEELMEQVKTVERELLEWTGPPSDAFDEDWGLDDLVTITGLVPEGDEV